MHDHLRVDGFENRILSCFRGKPCRRQHTTAGCHEPTSSGEVHSTILTTARFTRFFLSGQYDGGLFKAAQIQEEFADLFVAIRRHIRSEEHTSELQSLAYLVC